MKKFKLSENIDPNKVFIINRSELEGRLDINFNSFSIRKIVERIKSKGALKLIDITEPIKNGSTPSDGKFENSGVTYYRSQDFTLYSFSKNQYISEIFNSKIIRSYIKKGDILLAVVGATLGKVGYVYSEELEGNINQNMARIRINDERFLSEFVAIYLNSNIGQKLIQRYATITTQAYLNNQQLGKIPIPLLKIEVQQNIINILKSAYLKKQQKETEAQKLLDSIDDYLLGELGITLPKEDEHLLQNTDKNNIYNLDNDNPLVKNGRLFLTNLSEVTGKRWDAFEFKNRKLKLGDGNYPNKTLKHLAYLLKGQSITSNEIEKGDYPVIAGGQISPYTHNRYNFKGNVITISASGAYSGYVWYHNYPIFASDCTVVFSKEESEITTLYLSEILKLKQKEIYNLQQGAGQPHVYARDLEKINIPIPPLQKQKEITNKITAIREEAKKLQLEAINTLETAKRNIEQMILGN